MAQITLTLDLTPETLEVLKLLTTASSEKAGGNTPKYEQLSFDDMETEDADDAGKDKAPAKKSGKKGQKAVAPKEAPPEPEVDESDESDAAPEITLADVRAVALKLSKAGKQKQLKEIFAKYGADKLSAIEAKHYGDLMADLEAANE